MKNSLRETRLEEASVWGQVLYRGLPFEREMLLFCVVSLLDMALTYVLINHQSDQFVESNPIARYILVSWGFQGMAYFKLALVSVVVFNAQLIARQKPRVALRLFHFASATVGLVVVYSLFLLMRHAA